MVPRLEITLLTPKDETRPDVLGKRATIELPSRLPNLVAVHQTLVALHDQAPLFVQLLAAAKHLFPNGPAKTTQPDHIPEQGS